MLAIRHNFERRAKLTTRFNLSRRDVRRFVQSEGNDLSVKVAAELRDILIVSVQDRDTARVQRLDELVLGARDRRDGFKKLQVHRRDHGHDTAIRLRQPGERGDLAGMRHPHFEHCNFVLWLELQQLQRHAEMIIQIAFGFQHSMLGSQHVRDGFFGRGFAS